MRLRTFLAASTLSSLLATSALVAIALGHGRADDRRPPAVERGVPADLLSLSSPWRTSLQLSRLRAAGRAGRPLRFVVVGDAEPGRFFWSRWLFNRAGVFERQLRRVRGEDAAFTIQLGDMVSRGVPRNYRELFRELNDAALSRPYLTVLGNHDRRWPHGISDDDIYAGAFGSPDYFFDAGGVRFVVVDTSLKRVTKAQLAWLDAALDVPTPKVVFTHMPPAELRPWTFGDGGFDEGSEAFVELLSRRRVDRVYLGHVHGFGAMEHKGVRYVLTGGGGSPLFPSGADRIMHHYLVVEVRPDGLHELVRPLDAEAFAIDWRGAPRS